MRPWRWQIPRLYQAYIATQFQSGFGALFDALNYVEQTADGTPELGAIVEWEEDVFEWIVADHRIPYERLREQMALYMVDIQPLEDHLGE